MTSVLQRQKLLGLIHRACVDGARLSVACRQIGLSCRSVQRWQRTDAVHGDRRQSDQRRQVNSETPHSEESVHGRKRA